MSGFEGSEGRAGSSETSTEAPRSTEPVAEPQVAGAPPADANSPGRRILTWLGLVALLGSAILGSNMFSVRDRLFGSATPEPAPAAPGRVAGIPPQDTAAQAPTALRSQAWWQDVTTLEGTGNVTSSPFTISDSAIQWRAKWTCPSGRIVVRSPKQPKPVIDGTCPGGALGYATHTGDLSLDVTAEGPWRLEISQQIDAPLVEPPLPAMLAPGAATVASGAFYKIDQTGTGSVTVYRHADGGYSMRLDEFFVSPNVDLELRLSTLQEPRDSEEFGRSSSELVAVMDVTAGSLNYTVPAGIDPTKFRSVVIWCAPINSAYAAASLGTAR